MDIRARHMNTVNIKPSEIREFAQDLKRWKIRHYPFRSSKYGYEVTLFPNPKSTMLLLKYEHTSQNNGPN